MPSYVSPQFKYMIFRRFISIGKSKRSYTETKHSLRISVVKALVKVQENSIELRKCSSFNHSSFTRFPKPPLELLQIDSNTEKLYFVKKIIQRFVRTLQISLFTSARSLESPPELLEPIISTRTETLFFLVLSSWPPVAEAKYWYRCCDPRSASTMLDLRFRRYEQRPLNIKFILTLFCFARIRTT